MKPTCATQKVTTKLVSSSESESELGEVDGEGVDTGIPHQSTAGVVPHSSSHTISVSISIFFLSKLCVLHFPGLPSLIPLYPTPNSNS